jgi:hypothetical protein
MAAVAAYRSVGYRLESTDARGATLVIRGWVPVRALLSLVWIVAYATRGARISQWLMRYQVARKPVVWIGSDAAGNVITA